MAYGSASVSSTAVSVSSAISTTTNDKNSSLGVQDAIELRRRLGNQAHLDILQNNSFNEYIRWELNAYNEILNNIKY